MTTRIVSKPMWSAPVKMFTRGGKIKAADFFAERSRQKSMGMPLMPLKGFK